jgi:hypothetical protein
LAQLHQLVADTVDHMLTQATPVVQVAAQVETIVDADEPAAHQVKAMAVAQTLLADGVQPVAAAVRAAAAMMVAAKIGVVVTVTAAAVQAVQV